MKNAGNQFQTVPGTSTAGLNRGFSHCLQASLNNQAVELQLDLSFIRSIPASLGAEKNVGQ